MSSNRPDQFGRYSPLPRSGELDVLYDEAAYRFYLGPVIAEAEEFERFRKSRELRALRREFGKVLRIDPITAAEDGAANLVVSYFDVRKQSPRGTALQFADIIRRFLAVLDPAETDTGRTSATPPRDVITEMESWPARSFRGRRAYKKLAKDLRDASSFSHALLPFLHLVWPRVRLTPELESEGVDIAVGEPLVVVVHCSGRDVNAMRRAIETFRHSAHAVRDFIVIIQREEETVAYREALKPSLDRLLAEGKAQRVHLWNHRDDVVYVAFQLMLERVMNALRHWNEAMLDEQAKIERAIGAAPVRNVPFRQYQLRIDATSLRPEPAHEKAIVGDVATALTQHKGRILHVLLGAAGFGKTTSVMRAAREHALQWIVVPAARIQGDVANAHSLFEVALDLDRVLDGATVEERSIWHRIAGPVLKYLTQLQSGVGIMIDAVDESPSIGRSYGLHTFFNFFRRAVVPVVVTMRSEFWESRRGDFAPGKSKVESTVQTLEVVDLQPWSDEQIIEAARVRLGEVRPPAARARIEAFISDIESGGYQSFYGNIPRTPLFLRFILDVLDRRNPHHMSRRALLQFWIEQKIARDVDAPKARGGARLPIRPGIKTAKETIALSLRAMRVAAVCMSRITGMTLELLPHCTFAAIRDEMGASAPNSAEALALNSVLITIGGAEPRLRFAHRIFQEFFLAEEAARFVGIQMPPEVAEWQAAG
jgi:hypothetical protein